MVVFPPAKINLGLNVLRRRPDGYHDIRTVMMPIALHDILEVVVDEGLPEGEIAFARTGLDLPGDPAQDLCMRAVDLFKQKVALPPLSIHLHKVIPAGAGLGGGSSDAAHMLMLLDDLSGSVLKDELPEMAGVLGSDVPFFLMNRPQLAEGRGEILHPMDLDLAGKWLVLVNPGIHVSTADVYRSMRLQDTAADLSGILKMPLGTWQEHLVNDMEDHVFHRSPTVAQVKQRLMNAGAVYAAMSGSGSTVFGIFDGSPAPLEWPEDHRQWILPLN
jgi:4-diphosphocytidyl-2-C-methyl-D-erythritol kinase